MSEKPPGRVSREEIYSGRIIRVSRDTVRFPDGSEGLLELVGHPGASAVVPFLDPPNEADPRVVMVRQYRYAAGGILFEIPAGIPLTADEAWAACARRELAEEAGYESGDLRYFGRILTTPGFSDEVIHLFGAADLSEVETRHDEDEFIEVVVLPLSEILAKMGTGEIVDAKSIAALLFAATFRERLWEEDRTPPAR